MKIAIMQPYIFPYIGYFNLIYESDIFVLYNDVQYIERGWINRNRVISREGAHEFTIPLQKSSSSKLISDIYLADKTLWQDKFLKMVEMTYKKAPYFLPAFSLINEIFSKDEEKIDGLIYNSIVSIFKYLGVDKKIILSTEIDYDRGVDKVEKIISIANQLSANTILFPTGSVELYSQKMFPNFKTDVIKPELLPYKQFKKDQFTSGLSIIDLLMFNSKENLINHFSHYKKANLHESL